MATWFEAIAKAFTTPLTAILIGFTTFLVALNLSVGKPTGTAAMILAVALAIPWFAMGLFGALAQIMRVGGPGPSVAPGDGGDEGR